MNALLDSICKAGLNRARIHDALADIENYDGVTGHMVFDPNQKNVAPMYLGTVHNGAITYRVATMEKDRGGAQTARRQEPIRALPQPQYPYARVGEDGVELHRPHRPDLPHGPDARGFSVRTQTILHNRLRCRRNWQRSAAEGQWTSAVPLRATRIGASHPLNWCAR